MAVLWQSRRRRANCWVGGYMTSCLAVSQRAEDLPQTSALGTRRSTLVARRLSLVSRLSRSRFCDFIVPVRAGLEDEFPEAPIC